MWSYGFRGPDTVEDASILAADGVDVRGQAELLPAAPTSRAAIGAAERGVPDQRRQGCCEAVGIPGGNEESGLLGDDHLRNAADCAADDRERVGHCFQGR